MVEKGSKKDHQDKDVGLEVWKFPGVLICKDSMDLTVTPRMWVLEPGLKNQEGGLSEGPKEACNDFFLNIDFVV